MSATNCLALLVSPGPCRRSDRSRTLSSASDDRAVSLRRRSIALRWLIPSARQPTEVAPVMHPTLAGFVHGLSRVCSCGIIGNSNAVGAS